MRASRAAGSATEEAAARRASRTPSRSSPRWSSCGAPTARRARDRGASSGAGARSGSCRCCACPNGRTFTPRSPIARPTSGSWRQRRAASYAGVHRALLAGFCTMVGVRGEEGEYLGTRGVRFHIFPGSPLRRRKPRWVMAANIVETSRVFARARRGDRAACGSRPPRRICRSANFSSPTGTRNAKRWSRASASVFSA